MATELASRRDLDFELRSLSELEATQDDEPVVSVGSYVGEVIIRHATGATWARSGRKDPGVGIGSWLADPFDWVERTRDDSPSMPLEEYVTSVIAMAEDPSEATSTALGLETRFQPYTAWDQFSDWLRRRRHRP